MNDQNFYTPKRPAAFGTAAAAARSELAHLVVRVAELEHWPVEQLDYAMYVVDCEPDFAVRPDLHHFRERAATNSCACFRG